MYDILIIGAGITGTFLARDLSGYQLRLALLDKEEDIACGASMANSAIIHSGHDPKPNTLKARLNVRGNALYEDICKELGVAFRRCSAFVAATNEEESLILDRLEKQAKDRQIPVFRLDREEAIQKEPHLSDQVREVLELPSTGIITPWEVAIALAEEAVLNGCHLACDRKVIKITRREGPLAPSSTETSDSPEISTDTGYFSVEAVDSSGNIHIYETRRLIDAAGVHADDIYAMVNTGKGEAEKPPFVITPRKGEYYVLDHEEHPLVERIIYPVPSEKGKGVLVVPTIHHNLLIGPNSDFTEDKEDTGTSSEALAYIRREIGKTVKDIPFEKVIRHFSGLRPTGSTHDFIIGEAEGIPGFYLAAAIESPRLTSAPAISEYLIENFIAPTLELIPRETYRHRKPMCRTKDLTFEEFQKKIQEDPAYGHIICRCEEISEGEILDAIHRPAGARSIKGIRKRCRPGMGRCQGGFCEPLVAALLSRETGGSYEELLHIPSEKRSLSSSLSLTGKEDHPYGIS